jgi:hypothetical protein
MGKKKQLQKQIDDLEKQIEPLQDELNKIYQKEEDDVETKIEKCLCREYKFKPDDLIFSAYNRCSCGAGYAYPKNIGPRGAWYCSDILLGKAIPKGQEGSKEHNDGLPFIFWEIKSELQPSAYGATTREKIPS